MADDLRQYVSGTIRAERRERASFSEMTPDLVDPCPGRATGREHAGTHRLGRAAAGPSRPVTSRPSGFSGHRSGAVQPVSHPDLLPLSVPVP
jgi:hypothetical protein